MKKKKRITIRKTATGYVVEELKVKLDPSLFDRRVVLKPGLFDRRVVLKPGVLGTPEPETSATLFEDIDTALAEAEDGLTEAQLRKIAPQWYLNLLSNGGLFRRTKERRPNAAGRICEQWVWRRGKRTISPDDAFAEYAADTPWLEVEEPQKDDQEPTDQDNGTG